MRNALATLEALIAGRPVSEARVDELRALVRRSLAARDGRARGAVKASQEHSALKRGWVCAAIGAKPLTRPMEELVRAIQHDLKAKGRRVSDWLIRDEIRQERKARSCLGTETANSKTPFASDHPTSTT